MLFRALRQGEIDKWAALCADVFQGPEDTVEYFTSHFLNDPHRDIGGVFVAEDDGKFVGSVRVFRRELMIRGERVKMGGIGEVCTDPAYRKQGISGELLKCAIAYMEREGLNIGMLFTGINQHYARYGYFTVPVRSIIAQSSDEPMPRGYSLRELTEADMPEAQRVYAEFIRRFDGPVIRDSGCYWRDWIMGREWISPKVIEKDGRMAGYIDAKLDREKNLITAHDFAAAKDAPPLASVLSEIARRELPGANLSIPAAFVPDANECFHEKFYTMFRLNIPFCSGGERIDAPHKLARLMTGGVFFPVDGF